MGSKTKIEWADCTWSPVTGCTPVSAGCKKCYARRIHKRLRAMGHPKYQHAFEEVHIHPELLDVPLRWKRPRKIFVCSMSDLFHRDVQASFVHRVFRVMRRSPHTFQVLTKRSRRPGNLWRTLSPWPLNVWLGVTVEANLWTYRIDNLCCYSPARARFVSFEPLLGPISTDRVRWKWLDWVIVGGETGPGARPMHPDWAREIRDECQMRGIPFFMKQMAKREPIPEDLMIREFPE